MLNRTMVGSLSIKKEKICRSVHNLRRRKEAPVKRTIWRCATRRQAAPHLEEAGVVQDAVAAAGEDSEVEVVAVVEAVVAQEGVRVSEVSLYLRHKRLKTSTTRKYFPH